MPINLVGPDGREYVLDNEDPKALEDVLQEGFRQTTPEAPRTLGEKLTEGAHDVADTAAAGVLSGVSGASAGLFDAALHHRDKTQEIPGTSTEESIAKLKEEHPVASTVGSVAGMLLSPVGEVGKAVTGAVGATTALGRIGASALGGAAESTLFGAGNTVSDAVLGDSELTAEKLIAGTGLYTLLGAGGGAAGGALAEAAGVVVPKLGKALGQAQEHLEEFASNKALKAAGAAKKDLDYLGEEKAKEVGRMLLERGHLGEGAAAPNAVGVLESVSKDKEAVGASLGKIFDDAEAAGAKPDFARLTQRLDDFESKLSPLQRKAVAGEVQSVRDAAAEYGSKGATEGGGFKALNELKKDLQAKAKWSAADQSQAFAGGLKRELSGVVREELDQQLTQHLGPDLGKQFLDTKKTYGLLADAERIAEHGAEKLGGNASIGLRDVILGTGALAHGNPVTGLVSAIASKVMRERGNGVIARLATKLSESPALSALASSFSKKAAQAAPQLGQYGSTLATAAERSPQLALATHMVMAQADPHYRQAAMLAGFVPEEGAQQTAALARAHGIATLATSLASQDEALDRGIEQILKSTREPASSANSMRVKDFGAKRQRAGAADAHDRRVEEVHRLAADPSALLERTTANMGNLHNVAPAVAAAMTSTANKAVQVLSQSAQRPLKAGPLAPEWKATEAERHAFAQKLEVVQEPMSILKHAAAGTLTAEQVQTLKAVYPLLAGQIADKAIQRIADGPKGMPYKARLMLGLLTGADVDGTMSQQAISRNQAAIQSASKKPSNQVSAGPQQKSSQKGLEHLSLGDRTAMPQQSRDIRDRE